MITYTVRYKKEKAFFWKILKKVKGDGVVAENRIARFFILEDESRIEIPCHNTIFKFSKERFTLVKQRMDEEAGQVVPISKK